MICVLLMGVILYSCGKPIYPNAEGSVTEAGMSNSKIDGKLIVQAILPDGYTLSDIPALIEENINYHLWFDPAKVEGNLDRYDSHVGQTLHGEVLIYENEPSQIYARVDQIDGLFLFKIKNGLFY